MCLKALGQNEHFYKNYVFLRTGNKNDVISDFFYLSVHNKPLKKQMVGKLGICVDYFYI